MLHLLGTCEQPEEMQRCSATCPSAVAFYLSSVLNRLDYTVQSTFALLFHIPGGPSQKEACHSEEHLWEFKALVSHLVAMPSGIKLLCLQKNYLLFLACNQDCFQAHLELAASSQEQLNMQDLLLHNAHAPYKARVTAALLRKGIESGWGIRWQPHSSASQQESQPVSYPHAIRKHRGLICSGVTPNLIVLSSLDLLP